MLFPVEYPHLERQVGTSIQEISKLSYRKMKEENGCRNIS